MTPQARSQSEKSRSKKAPRKGNSSRLTWWPLIAAVAITPFAVKTAEILPLTGSGGLLKLDLLYPFAMLLRQHAVGLSESMGENLSHWTLYAQFPLYGLYAMVAMRWRSLQRVLLHLLVFHLLGFGAVWLLTQI